MSEWDVALTATREDAQIIFTAPRKQCDQPEKVGHGDQQIGQAIAIEARMKRKNAQRIQSLRRTLGAPELSEVVTVIHHVSASGPPSPHAKRQRARPGVATTVSPYTMNASYGSMWEAAQSAPARPIANTAVA